MLATYGAGHAGPGPRSRAAPRTPRLRARLRALAELRFDLAIIALILAMLWGTIGVWLDEERVRIEHGA
ncbi:hypothetical protein ACFQX4_11680 [Roseomonas sp. GCM10028921]